MSDTSTATPSLRVIRFQRPTPPPAITHPLYAEIDELAARLKRLAVTNSFNCRVALHSVDAVLGMWER